MKSQNTLSITEARKKIFEIVSDVQKPGNYYTFTENGRPTAVVLSFEEFDSLQATLEIMSDPQAMADIKKAEREFAKGEYVSLDDLKKELGYKKDALMVADKSKKKYSTKAVKYARKRK